MNVASRILEVATASAAPSGEWVSMNVAPRVLPVSVKAALPSGQWISMNVVARVLPVSVKAALPAGGWVSLNVASRTLKVNLPSAGGGDDGGSQMNWLPVMGAAALGGLALVAVSQKPKIKVKK
jgi:hypothetical protein